VCAATFTNAPASVTNALTHQGGSNLAILNSGEQWPCATTGNLPENTWSMVSADNAGQPCLENVNEGDVYGTGLLGDSDDSCDPYTPWNYDVQGHVTFGPPTSGTRATSVEVQVYIGGGGQNDDPGGCTIQGSTITCTNVQFVEDSTIAVTAYNESFRFSALELGLAPYYSTPGDGNWQAFYVFAKPINGKLQCTANNYATTEHN